LQTWKRSLTKYIKFDGFHLSSGVGGLDGEMLRALTCILKINDINEFHHSVVEFNEEFSDQYESLDFFERQWIKNDDLISRWSRAYISSDYYAMLTNNYIGSWYNQLKTKYFKRTYNRRLDRLVFILSNEVEYYHAIERERIMMNSGRMGPLENQQAKRLYFANMFDAEKLPSMIVNPQGNNSNDISDNSGIWIVRSFNTDDLNYEVEVDSNNNIISCTCLDYQQRRLPCKHIYLLQKYNSFLVAYDARTGSMDEVTEFTEGILYS
jgi:hypothetical protein